MNAILPSHADNDYRGPTVALWLLGFVVFMRGVMGASSAYDPWIIARNAHGIPLGSYPAAAVQTIVALFTGLGVDLLFWCALAIVILIRYRSLVPMMLALFMTAYIARLVQGKLLPIATAGTPPAPYVTGGVFIVTLAGFALSLWTRPATQQTLTPDTQYRGQKIALWIFAAMTALRLIIGINSTFRPYLIATSADGIPVSAYPAAAGQTIVSMFSALGVSHLLWAIVSVIVLVRYRTLVPLMFTFRLFALTAARIQHDLRPIPTVGTPPGRFVTIIFFALTVAGLALSLWRRPRNRLIATAEQGG